MKKVLLVLLVSVVVFGLGSFGAQRAVMALDEPVVESSNPPAEAAPVLEVSDYAFCEGVEEREPVGKKDVFTSATGKIYLWNVITGAQEPTEVKHVWYHGEERIAEIPLNIKYPRSRTWSYKTILPEWTGEWHVDIVDSKDNVLKKVSFKIEDASENQGAAESSTPASANPQ